MGLLFDCGEEAERLREADRFGAFVAIRPDLKASADGPLSGLSVAVKDNIAVAGMPFTAGHALFATRLAEADAETVRLLRRAGARIVGVTRTDAGGFGVTTPEVVNPLASDRIVGGSSGGSAAAVAAGLVDVGLGTDTGGSVRIPAACTGLFGYKPSAGRLPRQGVFPLSPTLDEVGVIARDLDALCRVAACLAGENVAFPAKQPARMRLGFDPGREAHWDPAIRLAFAEVLARLRSQGANLVEVALPPEVETAAVHAIIVLSEAAEVYRGLSSHDLEQLAPVARRGLAEAAKLTPDEIAWARAERARIVSAVQGALQGADAIIGPTLPISVPQRGVRHAVLAGKRVSLVAALTAETALFNLAGHPAVALPLPASGSIPFSLQLAGPIGEDHMLLALAGALASA